jgi:hypothetical protein
MSSSGDDNVLSAWINSVLWPIFFQIPLPPKEKRGQNQLSSHLEADSFH